MLRELPYGRFGSCFSNLQITDRQVFEQELSALWFQTAHCPLLIFFSYHISSCTFCYLLCFLHLTFQHAITARQLLSPQRAGLASARQTSLQTKPRRRLKEIICRPNIQSRRPQRLQHHPQQPRILHALWQYLPHHIFGQDAQPSRSLQQSRRSSELVHVENHRRRCSDSDEFRRLAYRCTSDESDVSRDHGGLWQAGLYAPSSTT